MLGLKSEPSGSPLIPRPVDGQCGPGMLDIDEEHLPVGREGRAGEFGLVHAIVPEAVELASGRYADQVVVPAAILTDDQIAKRRVREVVGVVD